MIFICSVLEYYAITILAKKDAAPKKKVKIRVKTTYPISRVKAKGGPGKKSKRDTPLACERKRQYVGKKINL